MRYPLTGSTFRPQRLGPGTDLHTLDSMHLDSADIGRGPRAVAVTAGRSARTARRPFGLDGFDLGVLGVFVAVSIWILSVDLWQVVVHGRVWTGTDGLFLTDQMQYLAWIQSASHQLLVSDLFVVHGSPADYFQPLVVISALLARAGIAAWLVLLLWKPVSVLAIFFAARAFTRAALTGRDQRRIALVIALFGGGLPAIGDLWPGFWAWGYPFPLIGIAALPGALVLYARASESESAPFWPAPLLGALSSWCHPWQGETLILIVLGTEVVLWLQGGRTRLARRRLMMVAVTVGVTLLPLLYLVALSDIDVQWGLARIASKHWFFPLTLIEALAPLLLASAFAYRHRPVGFIAIATKIWLPAATVVFIVSASGISATPLHAVAGITIPLAVLSVEGVTSLAGGILRRRRWLVWALVALVTVPTTVDELRSAMPYVAPSLGNGNFITREEHDAFRYLAGDSDHGGVLARAYLGLLTPALTGRHVYMGSCQWSEPDCPGRMALVRTVFEPGSLSPAEIRSAVLSTDVRFVLNSTCSHPGKDLDAVLRPLATNVTRFGCATVYELTGSSSARAASGG